MKAIPAPSANKKTKKPVRPSKPSPRAAKPVRAKAAKPTKPAKPLRPTKPIRPAKPADRILAKKPAKPAPAAPTAKKPTAKPTSKPILPAAKLPKTKAETNGTHKPAKAEAKSSTRTAPAPLKIIEANIPPEKDLSTKSSKGTVKDRIFLMVPSPNWLHVHWELSLQSIQRAEASLGQDWHGARPIIRLFDVTSQDTTSTSEAAVRDIVIQGGCSDWYIDIRQPPRSYRTDIGYISKRGDFKVLARSNVVTPPRIGSGEPGEEGWSADVDEMTAERLLAMSTGFENADGPPQLRDLFEEQIKRSSKEAAFGAGATLPEKLKKFDFTIDAELIVTGKSDPSAHVMIQNEPVKLNPDGSFRMRYALTDGRQILPAVAESADGMEERTIVLAIERNTKHLDPSTHELYGGEG